MKSVEIDEILRAIYYEKKHEIDQRLEEFARLAREATDKELFEELAFCTLTPQAKPREAERTLETLKRENLLYSADADLLSNYLGRVRFRYNKARFLVWNREQVVKSDFSLKKKLSEFPSAEDMRAWLVKTMKGIGWKEASHFLRNVGLGLGLAILDRHILRSLRDRFLLELPKTLTQSYYLEFEKKFQQWALEIGIPLPALDFVIFYKGTGEIFK